MNGLCSPALTGETGEGLPQGLRCHRRPQHLLLVPLLPVPCIAVRRAPADLDRSTLHPSGVAACKATRLETTTSGEAGENNNSDCVHS
ncbi:hypothetical protein SKAU_G00014970 [Synaphobranchus kaupii]|uniref:Uncharacterized protein n=1 Tax=Synaphobranchus kaupii TaxID=118154 RepID=A0A9Q1GAU2_SYNKA|nr:hypothetical protein SKAU_G00014970 [Synaphobranchus kaupii]